MRLGVDVLPHTADDSYTHDDQVLDILKNARERYASQGIRGDYIVSEDRDRYEAGSVCAIGAIGSAVGLNEEDAQDFTSLDGSEGILQYLENELRNATKEAIDLLENACIKLYPETADYKDRECNWAIEDLNETINLPSLDIHDFLDSDDNVDWDAYVKAHDERIENHYKNINHPAVLSVYDHVIAKREALC